MPKWIKVCDSKILKQGELLGFDVPDLGSKIMIAKIHDKVYAVDGICTHQYADLSMGFLNEEEKTVTCPLHLSAFRLEDGRVMNPPAEEPLKVYNVKVEDNWVYVLV